MTAEILAWFDASLHAAKGNLSFMAWNTFLAIIPFIVSLWIFRGRGSGVRRLSWWVGLGVFVAFLPNAPYVLTDIIHLVNDIRRGHSIWTISLILVPQYLLFMLIGFEAYVASVINLGHYLKQQGLRRWVFAAELLMHALCAIGIYLGRFLRFNSWDIVTNSNTLFYSIPNEVVQKRPLVIMLTTFFVIALLYWLLKQVTLALAFYWRNQRRQPEQSMISH